jgi:hypothetical protein
MGGAPFILACLERISDVKKEAPPLTLDGYFYPTEKCLSWTHAQCIFFKIVLVVNNKLLSCVYICSSIEVVT